MLRCRTRVFGGAVVDSAKPTVRVFRCGSDDCKAVHLIGFDDNHKPLCEIVISEDVSNDINNLIQKIKSTCVTGG